MDSSSCPHCGLLLESAAPMSALICPSCFNSFALPRSSQWTLLIVPIMAINYFVAFLL